MVEALGTDGRRKRSRVEAARGSPSVAMQEVMRKSTRRPPGATIESLARIDELARVGEMVKLTQADRLEWRDRDPCRWPAGIEKRSEGPR